ncbi:lytic transglycosylase domain-containing protein [Pontibacter harenae]|uniref:lytic transglycosylase domain-containing protein n=1 Tax=Pontibacter harenae TaxID=2894083 RepID=UPI001E2DE476|nr:lytic transglycosylase domain-containing protein [Pontibacter harenae]MCC9166669.1 LysM peptidoglycan-binding domain-containing protein [Pontibacter harenae]
MTYCRLFTLLAAVAASVFTCNAQKSVFSIEQAKQVAKSLGNPQIDTTTILSPEEFALLVENIPNEPNEVIQDRLSCIESDIPLTFNPFVRSHIDYFTIRNRKYTRTMLSRENVYFPLFEKYLKKYNMPQELKYLSIVESGLNPKAASWAGAVGLWQFIKVTGNEYGLTQNQYLDERMDPEKATDAACRFLSRLYKYYGDWELALAAYNCGQGNVNKAIRKAGGGKKTFWEVFPHLPRETRSYVPSMTAVIYSMKYAGEHEIFTDSVLYVQDTEIFFVNQALDLEKFANELHVAPETLKALNPELKTTVLPKDLRKYPLRIPVQASKLLAAEESCILLAASPTPAAAPKSVAPAPIMLAAETKKAETKVDSLLQKQEYIVRRGDNLSTIAQSFNITVDDLKDWNNLRSASIMPDQKLVVYQAISKEEKDNAASTVPLLASTEKAEAATSAKRVVNKLPQPTQEQKERILHLVQPGDTLWNISRKYEGITVDQIRKLNKLNDNSVLKPGQKLIIS